jgi:DNA (cytosine-5)-methyltransferase 1
MKAVSLFAGVGGFDLALERNGVEVVASVEIDKKAQEVLRRRFPNSTIFGDITEVKGEQLISAGFDPSDGIITGGFPCQDLSVAGKRAGLAGKRSGLFWEICRLLDETRTQNFILENVPGLLSSNNGRDMAVVIEALVERGYRVGWRVCDAQYFGVPQRRRRVFIVGSLGNNGRSPEEILDIRESRSGYLEASKSEGQNPSNKVTESIRSNTVGALSVSDLLKKQTSHEAIHNQLLQVEDTNVFGQSGFAKYTEGVTTLTATGYKRPEDNMVVTSSSFGGYQEGVGTLRSSGGDLGGGSENLVVQ